MVEVDGGFSDKVVLSKVVIIDGDLHDGVFGVENEGVGPLWFFATALVGGGSFLFAADHADDVGILDKGRVTILPKKSVSLVSIPLMGLIIIDINKIMCVRMGVNIKNMKVNVYFVILLTILLC